MAQDDRHLLAGLEPDQLTTAKRQPLQRRTLGRGAIVLLFALRLYVIAAIPVVVYAFIRAMQAAQ